jgi:IPT/TIG domain
MLKAVRDNFRADPNGYPPGLGLSVVQCECMEDGHPPERCGEYFYSIHPGSRRNASNTNQDLIYEIMVTISQRVNVAFDRIGTDMLLDLQEGIEILGQNIAQYVHLNYNLMNMANATILSLAAGTVYGFSEPLRFMGDDGAHLVGADWFDADPSDPVCGITIALRFGEARRLMPFGFGQQSYQGLPSADSLSVSSGAPSGGTSVVITGTSFLGVEEVNFGNVPASSFVVNSPTQITAISPVHAPGVVNVTTSTGVGTSPAAAGNQFSYT